jgi:hypothetical protein
LAYLEALSNPTPVQWKRREDLRDAKKQWPPEVGSIITLPPYLVYIYVYDNPDAIRRASELSLAHKVPSPEWDENDKNRVGGLSHGDKVRMLEITKDYACIEMMEDEDSNPQKPRDSYPGDPDIRRVYSPVWWDSNDTQVIRIHRN